MLNEKLSRHMIREMKIGDSMYNILIHFIYTVTKLIVQTITFALNLSIFLDAGNILLKFFCTYDFLGEKS